jgi:hypothetical protein
LALICCGFLAIVSIQRDAFGKEINSYPTFWTGGGRTLLLTVLLIAFLNAVLSRPSPCLPTVEDLEMLVEGSAWNAGTPLAVDGVADERSIGIFGWIALKAGGSVCPSARFSA